MAAASDPFYDVRETVKSQIDRVQNRYDKLLAMVKAPDSSADFKELRKGLVKELRAADKELKELRKAVETIDKNRQKFPHIKDGELKSRKQFVEDAQKVVNEVKAGIESQAVRRKLEEEENKTKRGTYDETTNAMQASINEENSKFIKNQTQQMTEMTKIQDENLDQLGQAVDRLGETGRAIRTELREQDELLNHLDGEIGTATEKMNVVQATLSKLLNTKDGCQIWTIVILGLILILLSKRLLSSFILPL
eukprot:gene29206-38274_t